MGFFGGVDYTNVHILDPSVFEILRTNTEPSVCCYSALEIGRI